MQHIINETQPFDYIKFDGQSIHNFVSNSSDVKIAIKELRLLKKLLNADKKHINNQLRNIRSTGSAVKSGLSFPSRGKFMSAVRWGTRLAIMSETQPLEQWKTYYNNLLLECDRIQIQLEKF